MTESPRDPAFVLPESYASLRLRGLTPGQIRGPRWRPTSRGFCGPAGTVDSPMQRVANASVRLPPGGVGTWAAARLHGVQWCDGYASDGRTPLPVMLFTGPDAHVRPLGCRVSQEPLSPMDTQQRYGIVCTTPVRTCFDGMRLTPDLEEAVVFADMMLSAEVVRIDDIGSCIAARPGWRGLPRARSALALAASGAKGPWETRRTRESSSGARRHSTSPNAPRWRNACGEPTDGAGNATDVLPHGRCPRPRAGARWARRRS